MNMSRLILSPCGTSSLTNNTPDHLRKLLLSTSDLREKALSDNQYEEIECHIETRRAELLQSDLLMAKRLSAELNGILTFCEDIIDPQDQHILLSTDTYQGQQTALLIETWLREKGAKVYTQSISDLSVGDPELFRSAMSDLVEWCENTFPGYHPHYRIVFNLTGGFKSVNGFLQTIGMFYADECIYIFQGSKELLRIPRLPVVFDSEGVVGKNLTSFRRLNLSECLTPEDCKEIPETLLWQVGQEITLSEWGKLVWNRCWRQHYQRELQPPLSNKLVLTKNFMDQINALEPDRLLMINVRLDQLAKYLETNGEYNPDSLGLKKIKGRKDLEPSDYEIYAWSDKDAKRIFGHYDGGRFQLDKLGDHL